MGFFDYLDRIRKKSERERITITITIACIITAVIVGLWLVVLTSRFGKATEEDRLLPKPDFSGARQELSGELDRLKEQFFGTPKSTSTAPVSNESSASSSATTTSLSATTTAPEIESATTTASTS